MFTDPLKNIESLGLHDGLIVADMGAGSGFYSIPMAYAVRPHGKVYALEVQQDLVERAKKEANGAGVTNMEAMWVNIEKLGGTKLRDGLCDVVLISNVLFQIEDKPTFVKEVARILKVGGRALVIDWSESFGMVGPHPDHVVNATRAKELFEASGTGSFKVEREINAGAHHYGIIFTRI